MQHSIFLPAATVFLCTFIIIHFSNHLTTSANGERHFLGDIAINCGCFSNSTALDGRRWVGETPLIQPKGKSRSTTISAGNLLTADPTPFFTARISSTQFSYSFQVNPGQKFLRLHFCPAPYQEGFRNSQDIFSVKANSFTLLQNFSVSLAADALGVKYFVKEFCLNVNETGILQITFSASRRISKSSSNTFVFVNGIEIISMPTGLYYTPDDDLGARVIGQSNGFNKVDNNTALELVQRLNVGGGSVLQVEDTGLFRSWSEDVDYMFASSGFQQIKHMMPAPAHIAPPFLAPLKIYQTSRIFEKGLHSKKKHNVTWKIPVDLGFCYLLRLHFCSFIGESSEGSPTDFSILIQNDIAESQVNVIKLSGGDGITVYRDYMVMMRGDKAEGKSDLSISLQSVDVLNLGLLKGLEIFKLSNIDNSLASPNPSSPTRNSSFWFMKIQNFQVAFGHLNVIMTALTILLAIVNTAFYRLRQICEHGFVQDKHVQSAPDEPSSHHFSLAEILLATRNFDDALVVGRGGFGKVYKGLVYGRPEVLAIKRLKPDSNQGAHEFWREIETLSKLRHIHLVPLIGYCNENGEMILVYEYMPRGTVADNIYKARMNGKEGIPLSWEQRLRICIGAARGLDYLHTGTQYGVIHRDVKATNILLDENYVAKISDFGLSKQGSTDNTQGQLSTKVWGTVGYLDPHYIATHKPSITSDVYAFGIVLLVVLSGRPAVETKFFSENVSLLACFQECMEKGEMKDIIDPSMQREISVESLTKFIEAVVNCVHHLPKKRPSMAQVVVFLEHALNGVGSSNCDKAVVDALLQKLANADLEEQRAAAGELRLLARRNPENRVCITEAGAIPFLVGLLSSPDSRTQEHSVTALLNLSIYDANKMTIVNAGAIPGIVNLLKNGSIEARENAAATLFSLALIDENKVAIGAAGAIPDLVDLLSHGTPRGKKDAATAIFNLSIYQGNKGKAVRAGIVPALMQLLKDPRSGLADEALAILTLLATNPEGGFAIGQSDPMPILVEVIGTSSPRNRENAAAVLWSLCTCDVKFLKVAGEFGVKEALKEMSVNGTDRGKSKAGSVLELLQRIEGSN